MIPDDVLDAVEARVRRLQPRMGIRRTTHSDVDSTQILDTGRFDFEAAKRHRGWEQALASDGVETDHGRDHDHIHDEGTSAARAHGVESSAYRRDRPFHPQRLDT